MLQIIEDNLDAVQQQKLIQRLKISPLNEDQSFLQKLADIPWSEIKLQLEFLEKSDVVHLINETPITEGMNKLGCSE